MNAHALVRMRALHDPSGAAAAAAACGVGAVLAYAGAASASRSLAIGGAALLALGIAFVLAGNWVDPWVTLVIALPMPALYESETLRIAPAVVLSGLVVGAWLLRAAIDSDDVPGASGAFGRSVTRAAIVLLLAVLLAALFAQHRAAAVREIVNWLLLLGLLFIAVHELNASPVRRRTIALAIGVVASLAGAIGLLQAVGIVPARFPMGVTGFQRATAGFGWPNELGMFLALTLPYAVYLRSQLTGSLPRALADAGIGAVALGLLATFSRGSWLAVLLAPIALVVAGDGRRALRIWLVALAVCVAVDLVSGGVLRERLANTVGDWVIEQRAALTLAGVLMYGANPVVGVGPGGFADSLSEYGPRIAWLWDYLPTAQNSYVQFAAEMGTLGLLAFVAFVIVSLRAVLHATRSAAAEDVALQRTALWALTTAALLAFNEWIFAHGVGQLVFLSAAIGVTGVAQPSKERTP
jgi:O-antigen ligase